MTVTVASALPQGDLRLLDHPVAHQLQHLAAHRRYGGEAQEAAVRAETDVPGLRMARTGLRPTWVGVLDFTTRLPGGGTADDFARRGQA
ncbi:hypothetical protein [Micromonospora endolithica]|uniref:Uncharacterized protein n=1 Tax=Micromonospora endolithica TaxID=230091 RepID=A0A3A9Z0N5_9ACTN|nr:hypothetical protein [Micromonospora endolithica]RKN41484.1 hypothetical protein D7223_24460 [Micromonospora endolithica]TWJ21924.1 hypothetical protein JD76_02038 [Micromonospora endolithica]